MESIYREDYQNSCINYTIEDSIASYREYLRNRCYPPSLVKPPICHKTATTRTDSTIRCRADRYILGQSTKESQYRDSKNALFVLMVIDKQTEADAIRIVKSKLRRWHHGKPCQPADTDDFAAGFKLEDEVKRIADGLVSGRLAYPTMVKYSEDDRNDGIHLEPVNVEHIYNAIFSSHRNTDRCIAQIRMAAYLSARITEEPNLTNFQLARQALCEVTGSTKRYSYADRFRDIAPALGLTRSDDYRFSLHPDTAVCSPHCKIITVLEPDPFKFSQDRPYAFVDVKGPADTVLDSPPWLLHECGQTREQIADAYRRGGWSDAEFDTIYESQVLKELKEREQRALIATYEANDAAALLAFKNAGRKRYGLAALVCPAKSHRHTAKQCGTVPAATIFTVPLSQRTTRVFYFCNSRSVPAGQRRAFCSPGAAFGALRMNFMNLDDSRRYRQCHHSIIFTITAATLELSPSVTASRSNAYHNYTIRPVMNEYTTEIKNRRRQDIQAGHAHDTGATTDTLHASCRRWPPGFLAPHTRPSNLAAHGIMSAITLDSDGPAQFFPMGAVSSIHV